MHLLISPSLQYILGHDTCFANGAFVNMVQADA